MTILELIEKLKHYPLDSRIVIRDNMFVDPDEVRIVRYYKAEHILELLTRDNL